ncbi:hypothetical protein ACTWQB_05805 [Piscibacillus sp. B03]|uniref:hypothetical protein n=1 Tax=Piscibacillus sp. B03 TaxID=3457430 RepID=UPI003FCC8206
MLGSTIILGWIGVIIYLMIMFTYQKLAKHNEYGFIHMLMALMYTLWLPIPIVLYKLIDLELLLVGTIFGTVSLIMMLMTMTFQTGHIVFLTKQTEQKIPDSTGNYMMATLSNPFEVLANVLRMVWAIFLALSFWSINQIAMAMIMSTFSLLSIYYLLMMIDTSLVKRVTFLEKFKPNMILVNSETLSFFSILVIYLTVTY